MLIPGTDEKLNIRNLILIISLGIIYFLAGKIGLGLAFLHPSATPIWAPTGIAIASFTIWGPKVWPGIFMGAFAANAVTAGTPLTSFSIAVGNTLEGLLGAFFIKKFGGTYVFLRPVNIFKYFLVVGLFTTLLSAVIGTSSLYLSNFILDIKYVNFLITWWLGDMGGALLIAPLILLWSQNFSIKFNPLKFLEFAICLGSASVINILIFSGKIASGFLQPLAGYLSLPFMIWIAIRFSPRETISAIFSVFITIIFGILQFDVTSNLPETNQLFLSVQSYMAIIFMTVMPLAASIYQQREVEESLRGKKEEYEKLINTSPDAILVTDLEGVVRFVNKKTLEMYGIKKRREIIGKSGFEFVVPEDQEKIKKLLRDVVKEGRLENVEYLSLKRDGSKFTSSANASVLYDSFNNPEEIMIISHDITKNKEVERMKTEFISIASHQLRTPLGTMRWSMEMLINGDYGEVPKYIKTIIKDLYDSLLRLIRLVNDLLDVSRIEEGRFYDVPQQVDVVALLKTVMKNMSSLTEKRRLKLAFKSPSSRISPILIGKEKLTDVFENLLSNSVKYTKPGGKIEVSVQKVNNKIIARFKDTGIGIPNKDKRKIFSKFYRSSRTTGMDTEGTGLGLFIVKSYLENWGGRIYFKSKVGVGSKFTIEIPTNPKLREPKTK